MPRGHTRLTGTPEAGDEEEVIVTRVLGNRDTSCSGFARQKMGRTTWEAEIPVSIQHLRAADMSEE